MSLFSSAIIVIFSTAVDNQEGSLTGLIRRAPIHRYFSLSIFALYQTIAHIPIKNNIIKTIKNAINFFFDV